MPTRAIPTGGMSSLSISNISKRFGRQQVLSDLSLEIATGEFFFLLGPSGCGKSTLLRIIAGLETPDSGSIAVDGRDIGATPPQKRGIGMVFQQYALWPHMTVEENIRFGLKAQGLPKPLQDERLRESLDLVRMSDFRNRYPHEISGGQQQRIAVARALALQPRILLLDEPLSNLDARLRDGIRNELRELHGQLGITIIYVTHDQDDALALATRMALLDAGRIVQQGTPEELYRRPTCTFSATFLGDANVLPVVVGASAGTRGAFLAAEPSLRLPAVVEARADGPASLCVRPEHVRIARHQHESSPLAARVASVTFHGSYETYEIVLAGDTRLRSRALAPSARGELTGGDRVFVGWDPGSAGLMDS